jgi:hypothetical protein
LCLRGISRGISRSLSWGHRWHEDIPLHGLDSLRVAPGIVAAVGPPPLRISSLVQVWCLVNLFVKILTRTAGGTMVHPVIVVRDAGARRVRARTQIRSRLVNRQSRRCFGVGGAPRVGVVTVSTSSGTTNEVHLVGFWVHRLDALSVDDIAVLGDLSNCRTGCRSGCCSCTLSASSRCTQKPTR